MQTLGLYARFGATLWRRAHNAGVVALGYPPVGAGDGVFSYPREPCRPFPVPFFCSPG